MELIIYATKWLHVNDSPSYFWAIAASSPRRAGWGQALPLRPAENSLGENRRCPWNSIRLRAVARRYRIAFPFQVKRARSEIDDAMISVENFRSQQPGNWRRPL